MRSAISPRPVVSGHPAQEFDGLADDEPVYKMVGPVLALQDVDEARSLVDRRIGMITTEIAKAEDRVKELSAKEETVKETVIALQQKHAKASASAAASGASS